MSRVKKVLRYVVLYKKFLSQVYPRIDSTPTIIFRMQEDGESIMADEQPWWGMNKSISGGLGSAHWDI